jgi:RNA polymerase sigma-70 factor, ECF subfamily
MGSREPDRDPRTEEFVRLFQRNERKLYGYILSLVPNIAAADEISQETYLRLWEQFDQFDPRKDFMSWASTIAYYRVLNYRTLRSREPVQFDSKVLEFVSDRISRRHDELAAKQTYLIDCLSQLSEFKRQVIRLYYTLGLTAKAVADKLGRNVAAVEKTLVRTRHTLHECVEAAMRREDRT